MPGGLSFPVPLNQLQNGLHQFLGALVKFSGQIGLEAIFSFGGGSINYPPRQVGAAEQALGWQVSLVGN